MNPSSCQSSQRPIAQRLADQPDFLPAPWRNEDLRPDHFNSAVPAKQPAEEHILHETEWRKAAKSNKVPLAQEKPLVAVNQASEPHTRRGTPIDAPIEQTFRIGAHGETTGYNASSRQATLHGAGPSTLERAVSVKKK